ncbi:hypothetical protein Mapa_015726 [Marchantia paleacea]|nr:hypothetical protein Mapa_015726 [Marchantia paleacea]
MLCRQVGLCFGVTLTQCKLLSSSSFRVPGRRITSIRPANASIVRGNNTEMGPVNKGVTDIALFDVDGTLTPARKYMLNRASVVF